MVYGHLQEIHLQLVSLYGPLNLVNWSKFISCSRTLAAIPLTTKLINAVISTACSNIKLILSTHLNDHLQKNVNKKTQKFRSLRCKWICCKCASTTIDTKSFNDLLSVFIFITYDWRFCWECWFRSFSSIIKQGKRHFFL